ncbi:MAG: hypothetical protein ACRDWS_04830 [Acidimicrobiia bacterium]
MILDRGRIIGTWESAKGSTIILGPFAKLSESTLLAIRDHAEQRYQGLRGEEPKLVVSDPP